MKRYLLFYCKKHFARVITCCDDTIFTEMHHALNRGEKMRDNGECLDYNVAIVTAPELKPQEFINGKLENKKTTRSKTTARPVLSL